MKTQRSENPSDLEEIPADEFEYEIECPRCGHCWKPNPNKWTDTPYVWWKGRLARVMYCPRCGLRSHFYKSDIEIYEEWYDAKKKHKKS